MRDYPARLNVLSVVFREPSGRIIFRWCLWWTVNQCGRIQDKIDWKGQGWQGCSYLKDVRDKMSKPRKRDKESTWFICCIFGLKNFLLTLWKWGRKFPDLQHKASFCSSGLISTGDFVGFGFSPSGMGMRLFISKKLQGGVNGGGLQSMRTLSYKRYQYTPTWDGWGEPGVARVLGCHVYWYQYGIKMC